LEFRAFATSSSAPVMLGNSPAIRAVTKYIATAARTAAKVLILGETGVGKDVVARNIHAASPRSRAPFVAINCSGIPETLLESELFGHTRGSFTGAVRDKLGLLQQADGGTLFLDELGEMSLRMQASLLRFLETGEVQRVGAESRPTRSDVRVIAATNRDLRQQIAAGAFREDLFYRLNVIRIDVPPLRDRGDDILLLFHHFLAQAARTHGVAQPTVTPDAAQLLVAHPWPGNVRELRNVAERLALHDHTGEIGPDDLPREILGIEPPAAPAPPREAAAVGGGLPEPVEACPERSARVDEIWALLVAGERSWDAVQEAFKHRELSRAELAGLVDRGLSQTRGNYRELVRLVGLDESDYKRFHAFLYQAKCNLPVMPYRRGKVTRLADFTTGHGRALARPA
jgi:DNA-binding NtrC family response regulator